MDIAEFDKLSVLRKNQTLNAAERYMDRYREEQQILEDALGKDGSRGYTLEVLLDDIGLGVLRCTHRQETYYHGFYKDEAGRWHKTNSAWFNQEQAILDAMGHKHRGASSHYADLAWSMLKGPKV